MMQTNYTKYPPLAMDEVMDVFMKHANGALQPINFGKGISSFNAFKYIPIQLTSMELGGYTGYGEINGLMSLRQAICRDYGEKFNIDLSPARVCITNGASDALVIALAMLVDRGGEVIIAESCYPVFNHLPKMFGAQCRLAPLNDQKNIDVEQLRKLITNKTQAIVINSPSNPHGAVLNAQELKAIAELGVPVIFDEVYQSLSLMPSDKSIPSAIPFSDEHLILNSFSKSLGIAGFRIGYLIVPEKLAPLMTNLKALMSVSTSWPSQALAELLFGQGDYLVEKHRQMLTNNWHTFKRVANNLGLKLLSEPKAGFFTTLDISETGRDGMSVAIELAKHFALGSAPGIDFQKHNNAFLRLNFACHPEQIEPGLHRLAAYMKQHSACSPYDSSLAMTSSRERVAFSTNGHSANAAWLASEGVTKEQKELAFAA